MKKLLIIASFLTLISCSHQDQKVRLDLSFDDHKSNIGNNIGVNVSVLDDRLEGKFLGTKEFCDDQKITITSEQNLADLLKKEITANLFLKGFKQGNEKLIEIHILDLKYKSECGFLLGSSKAKVLVSVLITNTKTSAKVTKNFEISAKNKHFLYPLPSKDAKIINKILEDVFEDILEDDILLR